MPDDTDTSIEEDLAALVTKLRVDIPGIETWTATNAASTISSLVFNPDSEVAKFKERFDADGSFGLLRYGAFADDLSAAPIVSGMIIPALISAAIKEGDPVRVLEEARAFAATKSSPARTYYAIGGVLVSASVTLSPTVRLLHWADVPDSSAKSKLSQPAPGEADHRASSDVIMPPPVYPGCAVEIDPGWEYRLLQFYEGGREYSLRGGPTAMRARAESPAREQQTADDVVRCLFLLSVKASAIVAQWQAPMDPTAARHRGTYLSYGNASSEIPISYAYGDPLRAEEVLSLWEEFQKLAPDYREILRRAIDRLCLAKRRSAVVDRAIDLGIALEMTLLHDDGRNELSYRLALRGASFLGNAGEDRIEIYRSLKKVYQLRSDAVHRGRFDKKIKPDEAAKDIEVGVGLGVRVVLKLIQEGDFPAGWEEKLLQIS